MKKYLIIVLINLIILAFVALFLMVNSAHAAAPPSLDQQQAYKWENTNPWSRPYLARLWEIPRETAEYYGAEYVMPTCGLSGISSSGTAYNSGLASGSPYSFAGNTIDNRWDITVKDIEVFVPIPYKIPVVDTSGIVYEIEYIYPPQLDKPSGVRWGSALPSSRWHLARLFGISVEEAAQYGAK